MSRNHTSVNALGLDHISWRTYNVIKKKAMEQEFSWSGLLISLSIAFFVVLVCAQLLNLAYQSVVNSEKGSSDRNAETIYRLEGRTNLNIEAKLINKLLGVEIAEAAAPDYQGEIVKNTDHIDMKADSQASYTAVIKNKGKKTWEKDKVFLETGPFLKSFSKFKHGSWMKYYRAESLEKNIKPGETASINFYLKSPAAVGGVFQENFQLVINDQPILGTSLRLFINVKNDEKPAAEVIEAVTDKKVVINTNSTSSKSSADFCIAMTSQEKLDHAECQTNLKENDSTNGESQSQSTAKEPIIRIGLFKTKDAQRVAVDQYYDVYAGNEVLLSGVSPNSNIVAGFDVLTKKYYVSTFNITKYTPNYLRIIPRASRAIITLLDYNNHPGWNTAYNDNKFRNIIEFHYSDSTKNFWVINELPIEDYLKGLAETSNASSLEFQKVLLTAARTYAMYHYNRGVENNIKDGSTKHADEHFHLDATYDQVYRGYGSEIRMPKLTQASNETRGMVMTYENKVVVTPYYSRSDGRTRSWEEVWYGNPKPWLKSVPVPEDEGQTLWGHGVGMSARGALIMASSENKNWQEILKYFYQGIDFTKAYN